MESTSNLAIEGTNDKNKEKMNFIANKFKDDIKYFFKQLKNGCFRNFCYNPYCFKSKCK